MITHTLPEKRKSRILLFIALSAIASVAFGAQADTTPTEERLIHSNTQMIVAHAGDTVEMPYA